AGQLPLRGPPTNRRGRSGSSNRRSQSRHSGFCRTTRRSDSRGGGDSIGSCAPMGQSGLPTNGGSRRVPTKLTQSAIITGSRMRKGGASGCSGRVFIVGIARHAGLSMASFPEPTSHYAELQVTTNFSFLRGAAHPDELVLTAAVLGHQAI